jgi:glutathione S-transferase
MGSQLNWGMQFKTVDPKPIFKDYVARCNDRPAAARANAQAEQVIAKIKPS